MKNSLIRLTLLSIIFAFNLTANAAQTINLSRFKIIAEQVIDGNCEDPTAIKNAITQDDLDSICNQLLGHDYREKQAHELDRGPNSRASNYLLEEISCPKHLYDDSREFITSGKSLNSDQFTFLNQPFTKIQKAWSPSDNWSYVTSASSNGFSDTLPVMRLRFIYGGEVELRIDRVDSFTTLNHGYMFPTKILKSLTCEEIDPKFDISNGLKLFEESIEDSRKKLVWNSQREGNRRDLERHLLVQSMIAQRVGFEQQDIYSFLETDLEDTELLLLRWYGSNISSSIRAVKEKLGRKFIVLLADPGIVSHIEKLMEFSPRYLSDHPRSTPFELRTALSHHLGTVQLYRGLGLSDEEAQRIMIYGISGRRFSLEHPHPEVHLDLIFNSTPAIDRYPCAPISPIEELQARIGVGVRNHALRDTLYMSLTGHKSIASNVASRFSGNNIHIFTVEVPELNVIHLTGPFALHFPTDHNNRGHLKIGDMVYESTDPKVEVFYPFWIKAEYIKHHEVIDRTQVPRYEYLSK